MNRRGGFLASMVRNLRKLAFGMKEQPTAAVEDFALEHFMLYHGLVGSSPENNRSFRDMRADLRDAVKHQSAVEMSIALKVPPLWWDDKLATIFSELNQTEAAKLRQCLLPSVRDDQPPEYDPLKHPDWRVRANTARMIAHLNIDDGVTRIADALHDTADSVKASFCHLAYALGQLKGNYAKTALIRHLHDQEPWFRVDAAGALAMFPLDEIASDLLKSILSPNNLSDYTAVVIARRHPPCELLKRTDEAEQDGAMEVVIGILEAAKGTFKKDIAEETNLRAALPQVIALTAKKRTPRRLRALRELVAFVAPDASDEEKAEIEKTAAIYVDTDFKAEVEQWLQRSDSPDPNTAGQVRHAIKLAGELHSPDLAPYLIPLLRPDFHSVVDVLDALAALQSNEAAPQVIELIDKTVNLSQRTAGQISKNNVFEDEPEKAKIYWAALKTLGCIPSTESARCLIKATQDFAPDKRQEALKSLVKIAATDPALRENFGSELEEAIASGLQDPATGVRSAALEGVRAFKLVKLLPEVLKVAGAKEVSIYQQSKQVLSEMQSAGFSNEIAAAARSRLSSEIDHQKRSRLKQLLDSIPSS